MLDECYWCGHERTCDHSDLEHWTEYDVPEDAVWTANGKTCSAVGERIDIYYCEGCDTEYRVRSGEYETFVDCHDYYDHDEEFDLPVYNGGLCKRCGYENQCEHENVSTWQEVHNVDGYRQLNGHEHIAVGVIVDRAWCEACDSDWWDIADKQGELAEEHDFFVWDDEKVYDVYTGKCEACGYENTCPHENAEYMGFWCSRGVITEILERGHTWTGHIFHWFYCPDCDWEYNVYMGPNESRTTWHFFSIWDDETQTYILLDECYECGHPVNCDHENAERWSDIDGEWKLVEDNHNVCGVYGERIDWVDCPDCHNRFSIRSGEFEYREEGHGYWREENGEEWYEGVCDRCGYENECDHPNADYWDQVEGESTAIEGDNFNHTVTGELFRFAYCPDCDTEFIHEATGETVTREERHNFHEWNEKLGIDVYTGECEACGYKNACEHAHVYDVVGVYDGTFKTIDHLTHEATGIIVNKKWCGDCDCDIEITVAEVGGTRVLEHWYVDDSNECFDCGFVCEHTELRYSHYIPDELVYFKQQDAETHRVCGPMYKLPICKSCNLWFMDDMTLVDNDGSWSAQHHMEDGVCVECGYVDQDVCSGWVQENGKWCCLDTNGSKFKNIWLSDGKGWLYLGEDGYAVSSKWIEDNQGWCYVDEYGYMAKNVWAQKDGKWYYLDAYGHMMTEAWVQTDGKWYYVGSDGARVVSSWAADSKGAVYLGADGTIMTNSWMENTIGWVYLGADGYMETNCWKQDSVGWCYLGADGLMKKEAWVQTDGKWYCLDANGYRLNNCWMKDQRGWIYLGADGAMMTNAWIQDSVGWCYLGADGYAVTNCWKQDSVGWCYLNSEGSMTKNAWVVTDGKTYWLNGEGYRAENTWVLVGGKWYWLNGDGTMATDMWQKDSIGWVYVGSDGAMVTDVWTKDSVGWCYMGSDGYAVTNTWKHDGTGWRYLNSEGSMMKNAWLMDGGYWYWFNADGYMVTGTVIIDGVENRFDDSGVWLG